MNRNKKMDKINNKGFTLLEVIFSISILTIGILAVAAMQASSIRGNAFAWGTSEASTVAMSQVERLMSLPYDDEDLEETDDEESPHIGVPVGNYNISWTVEDEAFINQTKTVDVTVSWMEHGTQKHVTMSIIIGRVV